MIWVVMYWPVQSWIVSLIGSFDSTAVAASGPARAVDASAAAASLFMVVLIVVLLARFGCGSGGWNA